MISTTSSPAFPAASKMISTHAAGAGPHRRDRRCSMEPPAQPSVPPGSPSGYSPARRQTLDPQPLNINSLVNGMLDLIVRSVGPGSRSRPSERRGCRPPLSMPVGSNALLNLSGTPRPLLDGGKLTIETSNRWMDCTPHTPARARRTWPCRCTFRHRHRQAEVISRAFDPFFTTKPIGPGHRPGPLPPMVPALPGQSEAGAADLFRARQETR